MHKFRIVLTSPNRGKVWIDDKEMTGVQAISFSVAVDEMVQIKLTLSASEVECEGEIDVTNINDTARQFAKAGA